MSKDWNGNNKAIYTCLGASNHTEKERQADDYYATDPIAIDKLLEVEKPYPFVWECACGEGHLSKRLKQRGYFVVSTDLVDRGYSTAGVDFLQQRTLPPPFKAYDIITNPPYKFGMEFVLKALELLPEGRKTYMFLKLTFLEGKARFENLFKEYPPKKVYVFSERVKCAKDGVFENIPSSAVAYAWFVWEKGYKGKTTIEWI